jgi:hypothetical protein
MKLSLPLNEYALIDDEDWETVKPYHWFICKDYKMFYVIAHTKNSKGKDTTIRLHRLIMDAKKGQIVDHINGEGRDNRRCNLRVCTHTQNLQNQHSTCGISKYKGVSWHKPISQWRAVLVFNKKGISLGYFKNEKDAAMAYDKKARECFGEFAHLNFP